ncbi:Cl- channel voltage-gated family protein [Saccharomonospora piscinae]|uniref:Cl-channel voltage-gated family protein n=1 Tax=Saccharomonospora piscinae TaxID=687388 RepID=A0A1V9ACJ5_SACPI|nr:chloride channel protein [Saccharomonospora piscinae]OQO94644.1 Cl- channel voltage-gated family protein [Saccharomonospora piscinae]
MDPDSGRGQGAGTEQDPSTLLRSREYVAILLFCGALGAPIALVCYGFLELSLYAQHWMFGPLPEALGIGEGPVWWPLPVLVVGGVLVGLVVRYLPGSGGQSPADGFAHGAPAEARELPGIVVAALVTLAFGAVLGPEAPLIALGAGLAAWALRLLRRGADKRAVAVIGGAGSFAAVSTLLGSPLVGAFLLMEIAGLGAGLTSVVLLPGLLAAGIGALIFLGLDSVTGLAKPSLVVPDLPSVGSPTLAGFGWALVIGVMAAVLGAGVRRGAVVLRGWLQRRIVLGTALAGGLVGALAAGYAVLTGRNTGEVLFSGEQLLGPLVTGALELSPGLLALLLVAKWLAYAVSMSSFRGGPIFPAMFLGAVLGLLLSELPGLEPLPAVAMGVGGMTVAVLRYPLVSVLLATLVVLSDGTEMLPLVIVAVVVSYVVSVRLLPVR